MNSGRFQQSQLYGTCDGSKKFSLSLEKEIKAETIMFRKVTSSFRDMIIQKEFCLFNFIGIYTIKIETQNFHKRDLLENFNDILYLP